MVFAFSILFSIPNRRQARTACAVRMKQYVQYERMWAVEVGVGVGVGLESGGLTPVEICLDSIDEAASSFYDYVLS